MNEYIYIIISIYVPDVGIQTLLPEQSDLYVKQNISNK